MGGPQRWDWNTGQSVTRYTDYTNPVPDMNSETCNLIRVVTLRIFPTSQCKYVSKSQHSRHCKYSTQFSEFVSVTLDTLVAIHVCLLCCLGIGNYTEFLLYFRSWGSSLMWTGCQRLSVSISGSFCPWILEHNPGYTADMWARTVYTNTCRDLS